MENFRDQYYCQTLELKRSDMIFKSEFCIASIPLGELIQHNQSFLHPKELEYFATLLYEKRQSDYLLGHFTAKQAIARYERGLSLSQILIDSGIFHFPVIVSPGKDKIQMSNSHTKQVCVAIAFSETHPMAIDIEAIDESRISAIETQVTAQEKNLIGSLNNVSNEILYTLFWTIKESLSKVLHTGLTSPFEIFAIKNIKFENDCWISEFENFMQYKVISFQLGDFICSIACPRRTQLIIDIPAIQNWFRSHYKP